MGKIFAQFRKRRKFFVP